MEECNKYETYYKPTFGYAHPETLKHILTCNHCKQKWLKEFLPEKRQQNQHLSEEEIIEAIYSGEEDKLIHIAGCSICRKKAVTILKDINTIEEIITENLREGKQNILISLSLKDKGFNIETGKGLFSSLKLAPIFRNRDNNSIEAFYSGVIKNDQIFVEVLYSNPDEILLNISNKTKEKLKISIIEIFGKLKTEIILNPFSKKSFYIKKGQYKIIYKDNSQILIHIK